VDGQRGRRRDATGGERGAIVHRGDRPRRLDDVCAQQRCTDGEGCDDHQPGASHAQPSPRTIVMTRRRADAMSHTMSRAGSNTSRLLRPNMTAVPIAGRMYTARSATPVRPCWMVHGSDAVLASPLVCTWTDPLLTTVSWTMRCTMTSDGLVGLGNTRMSP